MAVSIIMVTLIANNYKQLCRMKLYYIFHSGFAIVADGVTVILDFYEDSMDEFHGIVHDELLKRKGKIYVLASHFHPDHFNKQILSWKQQRPDIIYILSKDILRHKRAQKEDATFLIKGEVFDDGTVCVKAYGSTDSGVSFLITLNGKTFFHAGDLNNWHWVDESTPAEVKKAEGDYLAELNNLAKDVKQVDVVMFPVDRRLGTDYSKGARQFVNKIRCQVFVPMHFTYDYEGGNAFQSSAEEAQAHFLAINRKGQCFNLEDEFRI